MDIIIRYLTNSSKAFISFVILSHCIAFSSFGQEMHMEGMGDMKHPKNVFVSIMDNMMTKMENVPKNQSTSRTFISQMIPHHQGAIAMAEYEIKHGKNFEMIQLAKSIKTEQQSELTQMKLLMNELISAKEIPESLDEELDKSMETMMHNMPPENALKDVDHAFALVMLPHHQAAIDMARVLLKYPGDALLSAFARKLISDEQIEIEQMSNYINK